MKINSHKVFPSFREPLTGWIDLELSVAGEIAAIGKGLKTVTYCNKKAILNLMPVDSNARGMITIAAEVGRKNEKLMNFKSFVEILTSQSIFQT